MDSTLENFELNELLNCYYFSGGASCTALPFLGATCMPLVPLWELYFLLYHTFAQCKGTQISESEKFLPQESGIEENFAYRILKPRFWNPEYSSRSLESYNDWNPESRIQNMETRFQDLSWIPLYEATHIVKLLFLPLFPCLLPENCPHLLEAAIHFMPHEDILGRLIIS